MSIIETTTNTNRTTTSRTDEDISPPSVGTVQYHYALADAAVETKEESFSAPEFKINLLGGSLQIPIVPGSVSFTWNGASYTDKLGKIYRAGDNDASIYAGTVDYSTGDVDLEVYDGGDNTIELTSLAGRIGAQYVTEVTFRTPGRPLRPGQLVISGVTMAGDDISAVGDFDGEIEADHVRGSIDYENGICHLEFGTMVADSAAIANESWYDPEEVEDGYIWKPEGVAAETLTYGCVIYSYIPLDSDLTGVNSVRLPSDGRVPIVKSGDVVVIHNTQQLQLPETLVGEQIISIGREADSVELYDRAELPQRVPTTMYQHEEGWDYLVIDAVDNDFSAYTLPLVCMHKIEDMSPVRETQISGQVILSTGVTNSYPVDGTFVSSALTFGDLSARYYGMFDQKTWKNVFSDAISGDPATGTFNEINFPIEVNNSGCVQDMWGIVFDSDTHFSVMSNLRGVVDEGYTTQDCQPINPATNEPFFMIPWEGWGSGWAAGNVLRFNTESASRDLWICRTTLQGPATEPDDYFQLHIRGDAE